jgi:hypothetical protein
MFHMIFASKLKMARQFRGPDPPSSPPSRINGIRYRDKLVLQLKHREIWRDGGDILRYERFIKVAVDSEKG